MLQWQGQQVAASYTKADFSDINFTLLPHVCMVHMYCDILPPVVSQALCHVPSCPSSLQPCLHKFVIVYMCAFYRAVVFHSIKHKDRAELATAAGDRQ